MKSKVMGMVLVLACFGSLQGPALAERHAVHLIAGPPSHGWGMHEHVQGCEALAEALNASGLAVQATVHTNGMPEPSLLEGARAVVIFSDGGDDPHVAAGQTGVLRKLWERGCGLAVLHYALMPSGEDMAMLWTDALGGRYEAGWSVNPVWTVQSPTLGKHPVTRGVRPFDLEDEWYYHMRFRDGMQGVTPVLSAVPPRETVSETDGPHSGNPAVRQAVADRVPQHLAWVSEDKQGHRGFGFSGGHFHTLWAQDDVRRLVLNGIVWTAGLDVPAKGVDSSAPVIVKHQTLTRAVALDDAEDVKRHIQLGADVNAQSQTGWTALHHAAVRNKPAAAGALLTLGADTDLQTNSGKVPLHFCGERGFLELAQLLVLNGAKLAVRDQEGWTPLHYAAARDKVAVARFLIEQGADVNATSMRGGTPLHEAAASASREMMELLLRSGGDPSIKATNGKTPLDYAIELENPAAVDVLNRNARAEKVLATPSGGESE